MARKAREGAKRAQRGKAASRQSGGDGQQRKRHEATKSPVGMYQGRIHGSLHGAELQKGGVVFVADVQYGDTNSHKLNYIFDDPYGLRFYSRTLDTFSRSARHARQLGSSALVLLGDQVDDGDLMGDAAAAAVLECAEREFDGCPVGYLLGNHDTVRTQLFRLARANSPVESLPGYFVWECTAHTEDGSPPWLLIALDCFGDGGHCQHDGGIGDSQLKWLRHRLQAAGDAGQNVVLLSHVGLHPDNDWSGDTEAKTRCVPDYWRVQNLLAEAGCVRLCMAGHDHLGAYHLDTKTGIQYFTLPACLAAGGPSELAGAVLKLYRHRAVVTMLNDGAEHEVLCGQISARVQGGPEQPIAQHEPGASLQAAANALDAYDTSAQSACKHVGLYRLLGLHESVADAQVQADEPQKSAVHTCVPAALDGPVVLHELSVNRNVDSDAVETSARHVCVPAGPDASSVFHGTFASVQHAVGAFELAADTFLAQSMGVPLIACGASDSEPT